LQAGNPRQCHNDGKAKRGRRAAVDESNRAVVPMGDGKRGSGGEPAHDVAGQIRGWDCAPQHGPGRSEWIFGFITARATREQMRVEALPLGFIQRGEGN